MKKSIIIVLLSMFIMSCASVPAKNGKIANYKDMQKTRINKRVMLDSARGGSYIPTTNLPGGVFY